ncbi:GAF domain-containing protein [Jeongeupia naejangsanensis]|uniref:GAF domain-containing protein n=1 Tax=Jeongeupia naejangsanensis TaxID=613195 RepID=A0ABS2BQT4_9NEIS|nr:GAF domain-containing protein [Jeongeupia naejangsanensis]MBM3117336.1 GAF domain-containing protein [Jeongeupia naejangsanensis]
MQVPRFPADEAVRLATLRSLLILDTAPEERFDNLTRAAAGFFRVAIAVVSLIDTDRQWFKSACGLDVTETSREVSFCAHAILEDDAFVVEDALLDPRFADNPLVTGAPNIRFYAGAPVKAGNGCNLGTLCLIDRQPRKLEPFEREMLVDMAKLVEIELLRDPPA